MDLDALVESAKEKISQIIQKPKMSEKLLQKPPFRFLHDTVSAVVETTGFGADLYSGEELQSAGITEKQAKINYLEKIFNLGHPIDVRAAKVIAGLEPECTNTFLIAFAEVATDPSIDGPAAVSRCLNGEVPGTGSIPKKGSNARAESKEEISGGGRPRGGQDSKDSKGASRDQPMETPAVKPVDMDLPAAGERGKSRGGTRGGKPTQATADTGLSRSTTAPNLDAYIERCDGSEAATQEFLGAVIQKPNLTEKLLQKPPVRFLHDIVKEVIRVSGFGTGLYTPEELDSGYVAERQQKIDFLEKIIKLVGVHLNTLVDAKPVKIIAGLDAVNTNRFLQLLGVAAKYVPDSAQSVRTVLEMGGAEVPAPTPAPAPAPAPSPAAAPAPANIREEKRQAEERPRPAPRNEIPQASEPKETPASREMTEDKHEDQNDGEDGEVKKASRPTTARRRPPKIKDGAKEVTGKDAVPSNKKAEGIMIDGQADEDDDEGIADETQQRLADVVKADSKSVANGADPQSKIVKDILSRQAEQEAARRPQAKEDESKVTIDNSEVNNNTGGTGVRLGRMKKSGTDKKAGTGTGSTIGETDMERMRASIQALVQHTGPLGTCMDFIQEDIGLMSSELHRWEEDCRKYEALSESERLKTQEVLQPFQTELMDLEEQMRDKIAKISSIKSTIAKNEDKMTQMLKLMVTA